MGKGTTVPAQVSVTSLSGNQWGCQRPLRPNPGMSSRKRTAMLVALASFFFPLTCVKLGDTQPLLWPIVAVRRRQRKQTEPARKLMVTSFEGSSALPELEARNCRARLNIQGADVARPR